MEKNDVLLARQPIYDRKMNVVAYELLFRPTNDAERVAFDGNMATSRVLLNLFTESDISSTTDNLPAFVNFTKELLFDPPMIDSKDIVIEVLEDIEITPEVVEKISALKKSGFKIALDDFVMSPQYEPLLPLADIVKLELPQMDEADLRKTIPHLKKHDITVLAEKVETQEEYKLCYDLGCDYYQGYFLCKPELVKGKKMADNKLAIISLIAEIQNPKAEVNKITDIITSDPSLSFKLLKLVNSAANRRVTNIDSIHRAVTMLGVDRIRSWASLLALSKLDDKPLSLHHIALMRAVMCEKLYSVMSHQPSNVAYTVGLFSCLDAFFDQNLADVVEQIPLESDVKSALVNHEGVAGLALRTTLLYESDSWSDIAWDKLNEFKLDDRAVNDIYFESAELAKAMQST